MANFVTCTFTAANDTAITSVTNEVGGTWTKQSWATNTLAPKVSSGQLIQAEANGTPFGYFVDTAPPSADYSVAVDLVISSSDTSSFAGVMTRSVQGGSAGYYCSYNNASLSFSGGYGFPSPSVGSQAFAAVALNGTYRLYFTSTGSTHTGRLKRLSDNYWMQSDGTFAASEVNAFSFSESFYTAAGRPLLLSVSSNATGTKFDNFAAFTGTEDAGSSASVVPIITNMRSQSRIF